MSLKKTFLLVSIVTCTSIFGQRFSDQIPSIKKYQEKDILDSVLGINIYAHLVTATGGDSIKYNGQGYNLQGWHDDFYLSGKLLHRGYYVNGQLITFKNFFENGQCERVLMNPDPLHCIENIYFSNGNPRRETSYYNGLPQKRVDYYENGFPRYAEENEKEMKYLIRKKSWHSNGSVEESIELVDPDNGTYNKKSWYSNGQLKDEGRVVFLKDTKQFVKDGTWSSYDSDGKNKQVKKYSKDSTKQDASQ